MFTADLFVTSKNLETVRCPSVEEGINSVIFIHWILFCKKDPISILMNLKNIIANKSRWTQKKCIVHDLNYMKF